MRTSKYLLLCLLLAACARHDDTPSGASATFTVDPVSGTVMDPTTSGAEFTNLVNARVFQFKACMKDVAVLNTIVGVPFQILDNDRVVDTKTTDSAGCVTWSEKVTFDPSRKETFLTWNRTLKPTAVHQGQFTIPLVIDPWSDDKTAVRDLRTDTRPDSIDDSSAPSAALDAQATEGSLQVVLTNVYYKFKGRTFAIDNRLNLSTIRTYGFTITPMFRRMGRNGTWLPPQAFGDGKFRVRFLLETTDPNHPEVIDAETVEDESNGNQINLDVSFKIDDLRVVQGRVNLTIEVRPINEPAGLIASSFVDTFVMTKDGGWNASAVSRNAAARFTAAEARTTGAFNAPLAYATALSLEMVDDAKLRELGIDPANAESLFAGDTSKLEALCPAFFPASRWGIFSELGKCKHAPQLLLSKERTEHVRTIRSANLLGTPVSLPISMTASYSTGTSWSSTFSAGISGKLDLPFGFGANAGWSTARTTSRSVSNSNYQTRSLSVDQPSFEINADVVSCWTVRPRQPETNSPRLFYCSPKPVNKTVRESYYFVYERPQASAVQDPDAAATDQSILMLVRGAVRYQRLIKALQDANTDLNVTNQPVLPASVLDQNSHAYDGAFPGLLGEEDADTQAAATKPGKAEPKAARLPSSRRMDRPKPVAPWE